MEKVYSFFILVDSKSNWPGLLKLGMKTPCLGMVWTSEGSWPEEVGDWGFLCDLPQLSLGWDRSVQLRSFSENLCGIPGFSAFLSAEGHGDLLESRCVWLLATEASCILMLLGGDCLFLSLKTQSERKEHKEDKRIEKERGGRVREHWIDCCLFRSSWKTQWSEKASWLVCFSSFFFPGFEVGREGWENRKMWRIGKAWAEAARSLQG